MEIVQKYAMRVGTADRLVAFPGYKFFTPALLYIYGKFNDRPLADFLADYKDTVHLLYRKFEKRIFFGLDVGSDASWNYVLWGMEAEAYREFENFMLSVTQTDSEKKIVYRIGVNDLKVADPLYMDTSHNVVSRLSDLPSLDITAFGTDASDSAWSMTQLAPVTGILNMPRARMHPPQRRTVLFAKEYFSGNSATAAAALGAPTANTETFNSNPHMFDVSEVPEGKQREVIEAVSKYKKEMA